MNCGLIKSTVMHSVFIGCIKHSHKLSFKEPVCEIMFVCLIPKLAIFTQFNWHWRSKWHKVHYFWGINDYVRTMCVRYVLKNASLKNYVFKRPNPFMTVLKQNATFMRFNFFSYIYLPILHFLNLTVIVVLASSLRYLFVNTIYYSLVLEPSCLYYWGFSRIF